MNLIDYIRQQINMTHGGAGMADDLTDEQFNWQPPGCANSIAATMLHVFGIEDLFVQGKLLEQPTRWETGGWAEKIGVTKIPDMDNGWSPVQGKTLDKATVIAYGVAVQAATQQYLATLNEQALSKPVQMGPRLATAADLLSILVIHNVIHGGEIAAVKGFQGLQGQPV